ncbi:MAG: hypothetical protein PUE38_01205, partial [Olsenella sp.]|nr:hypothetical protein [Olsenella sp.]
MARFALIAPAVHGTFDQATKAEYFRSVSAKLVRMPDGTERRFPEGTLMFWVKCVKISDTMPPGNPLS